MNKSDFNLFSQIWMNAHAMSSSNKPQTNEVIKGIFEILIDYDVADIGLALRHHCKTSRFAPTPADIVKILNISNKRMSADEAWSLCPASEDETVVWADEIAEAFGAAASSLDEGDRIAARMAFKSAYERICEKAELERRPVKWSVSLGFDKTQREPAIRRAVESGFITHQQAKKLLPSSTDGGAIGKLLTGKVVNFDEVKNKKARQRLKDIKSLLDGKTVVRHD